MVTNYFTRCHTWRVGSRSADKAFLAITCPPCYPIVYPGFSVHSAPCPRFLQRYRNDSLYPFSSAQFNNSHYPFSSAQMFESMRQVSQVFDYRLIVAHLAGLRLIPRFFGSSKRSWTCGVVGRVGKISIQVPCWSFGFLAWFWNSRQIADSEATGVGLEKSYFILSENEFLIWPSDSCAWVFGAVSSFPERKSVDKRSHRLPFPGGFNRASLGTA